MTNPFETTSHAPIIQPSQPTLPVSLNLNYQFDGDLDPKAMDSKLCFQQQFALLSMKYKHPWNHN